VVIPPFTWPVVRPRVVVSRCLLGEAVRYDGGHRASEAAAALAAVFEVVPACPEAEAGLGVPRPPVQRVAGDGGVRVRGVEDPALDVTAALEAFGAGFVQRQAPVHGMVGKARSPSCAAGDSPLFDGAGQVLEEGAGVFAAALRRAWPGLPVVDEAGLARAPALFAGQVAVFAHWQSLGGTAAPREARLQFHAAHRLRLLAHDEAALCRAGRLLFTDPAAYIESVMQALARPPGAAGHERALARARRHLAPGLPGARLQALDEALAAWREGGISLDAVRRRLRGLAAEAGEADLAGASYLRPHPAEAGLSPAPAGCAGR